MRKLALSFLLGHTLAAPANQDKQQKLEPDHLVKAKSGTSLPSPANQWPFVHECRAIPPSASESGGSDYSTVSYGGVIMSEEGICYANPTDDIKVPIYRRDFDYGARFTLMPSTPCACLRG